MFIGVVGKANVGKSTFFKSSTLAETEIANYPFATIKAHHGVGFVKIDCVDKEFGKQCNPRIGYCVNGKRFLAVDLLDVAGLVPGAHEGKGMGNAFLEDLRQADALVNVIDISGSVNDKGEPVEPLSYDPANDIKFLETELDMWYLQILQKGWEKFVRAVMQEKGEISKAIGKQLSALKIELGSRNADKENYAALSYKLTNCEQELREFSYFVSHDLKSPLRAIGSIAHWLETDYKSVLDRKGLKLFKLLVKRVKRMNELMDSILIYSKLGRLREAPQTINLRELVQQTYARLKPPKNFKLVFGSELPHLLIEQRLITLIFENLFENAIKFSDKTAGQVQVTADEQEEFLRFCVADDGPGIENKYFKKIRLYRERFFHRGAYFETGYFLARRPN